MFLWMEESLKAGRVVGCECEQCHLELQDRLGKARSEILKAKLHTGGGDFGGAWWAG